MLSEKIQTQIDREFKKYPADQRQSAVMAALRFVQDEKGWIAPEDMSDIAAYIGMPQMAVYEVATFYHMYKLKPMGRTIRTAFMDLPGTGPGVARDSPAAPSGIQLARGPTEPGPQAPARRTPKRLGRSVRRRLG